MASNAQPATSEPQRADEESVNPQAPYGWTYEKDRETLVRVTYNPPPAGTTNQPTTANDRLKNIAPPAVFTVFEKAEVDAASTLMNLEKAVTEYLTSIQGRSEVPPPPPPSPVSAAAHSAQAPAATNRTIKNTINKTANGTKKRTPLPSSRSSKPMLPTPPDSPDHPGKMSQPPTTTQNEESMVKSPSRKSAAAPESPKEKKARKPTTPTSELITPEPFLKTEEELKSSYQEKLMGVSRCDRDWAEHFREGQFTALGLERGVYLELEVPGKRKNPGTVDRKVFGEIGGKIGTGPKKFMDCPTAAFAIYAVLAKVPGDWMTLDNIRKTVEEWLPNVPNEEGKSYTFKDQTYRRNLTKTTDKNGEHVFGNDGYGLWCILGVNEKKDHYKFPKSQTKRRPRKKNSPAANSSSTNSSQDRSASSRKASASSAPTTPEKGPILKRKNSLEEDDLVIEDRPTKKQRSES